MNDVQRSQISNLERDKATLSEQMKSIGAEKVELSEVSKTTSSK